MICLTAVWVALLHLLVTQFVKLCPKWPQEKGNKGGSGKCTGTHGIFDHTDHLFQRRLHEGDICIKAKIIFQLYFNVKAYKKKILRAFRVNHQRYIFH